MDYIVYNGDSSLDIGIKLNPTNPFAAPARRVTPYTVPGRNGVINVDDGTFENVQLDYEFCKYNSALGAGYTADAVKRWLCQDGAYHRLEDSRWPDHYRMARALPPEITPVGSVRRSVQGTISFDCLPERWLKSGETPVELRMIGSGKLEVTLLNPTAFSARPTIIVPATQQIVTVRVRQSDWYGYAEYTILAHDSDIQIDTYSRNAVYISGSLTGVTANSKVLDYQNGPDEFELRHGESVISATISVPEDITVKLIPGWWEI